MSTPVDVQYPVVGGYTILKGPENFQIPVRPFVFFRTLPSTEDACHELSGYFRQTILELHELSEEMPYFEWSVGELANNFAEHANVGHNRHIRIASWMGNNYLFNKIQNSQGSPYDPIPDWNNRFYCLENPLVTGKRCYKIVDTCSDIVLFNHTSITEPSNRDQTHDERINQGNVWILGHKVKS